MDFRGMILRRSYELAKLRAMDTITRESTPHDIGAITAIFRHAVLHGTGSFEIDPPDAAEMARRRATIVDAGYPYLVAERAGVVVGYSYAGVYRPRPAYRFTVENSVYVAPDQQGAGIGRALLTALLVACEAREYRLMVAVIGDSANHASIALHASLGFVHAGALPAVGWKHGVWLDSVLMTRALGDGAATAPAS
jgi:L-amino acid N-acyltransferase YncA